MERAAIVRCVLVFSGGIGILLLVEIEGYREVGRIPWHGVLGCDVKPHVGKGERFSGLLSDGISLYGILLRFCGRGGEGILKQDVLIKRIVFGRSGLA